MDHRARFVAALLLAVLLGACGGPSSSSNLWQGSTLSKAKERGRLVIGLEAKFKPFEYIDENGELVGFDVDLGRILGAEMDIPVEFMITISSR